MKMFLRFCFTVAFCCIAFFGHPELDSDFVDPAFTALLLIGILFLRTLLPHSFLWYFLLLPVVLLAGWIVILNACAIGDATFLG